ncbi:MAG: putative phage abortive infection protein [Amphritea sp.]
MKRAPVPFKSHYAAFISWISKIACSLDQRFEQRLVKFLGSDLTAIYKPVRYACYTAMSAALSIFVIYLFSKDSSDGVGTFGDFFGGLLNPVVAFCALVLLTISIFIQRKELSAATEAMTATANAQKDQARTQNKQRFEDTFFALLEQHNKLIEKLSAHDAAGMSTFEKSLQYVEHPTTTYSNESESVESGKIIDEPTRLYFRVLYNLLKYIALNDPDSNMTPRFTEDDIEQSGVSVSEKMYANFVRTYLSSEVLTLLVYNCVLGPGGHQFTKFKQLVERYALLEHIRIEYYPEARAKALYQIGEKAYGDNKKYPWLVEHMESKTEQQVYEEEIL